MTSQQVQKPHASDETRKHGNVNGTMQGRPGRQDPMREAAYTEDDKRTLDALASAKQE